MSKNSIFLDAVKYLVYYPRYVYSLYRISRLKRPIVTIFGGKQAEKEDEHYQQAFSLAKELVQNDFSILTGGGPGIMESALCGGIAESKKDRVLGIGVHGVDVDFVSSCGHETIFLSDFAARKWILIHYSIGFICFPGGLGTLDEIAEVLNLIKTKKIEPIPIVLIGTTFWQSLIKWIYGSVEEGYIPKEYSDLFSITDDLEHALSVMLQAKKKK